MARISDYPSHYAAIDPDRPALLFEDQVVSYAELARQVDRLAAALHASGVRAGDRVAVLSAPRPAFFVAFLATARLGGIWLGLNPSYTVRELAYVLGDAQPRLVFTIPGREGRDYAADVAAAGRAAMTDAEIVVLTGRRDDHGADLAFLDRAERADLAAVDAAVAAVRTGQSALIVYTSGSTGAPKGALIRHAGLVRLGRVESAHWAVAQPRLLCNLPINHIGCVGDLCGVPLVAGGSIVFQDRFDPSRILDAIARHQVSGLFQVPTQLQRIAAAPEFADADLTSLQLVGWGGGPLPLEVIRRYRKRGVALMATYGSTEVTSSVTYTDRDADDEVLLHTVGRPDPELNLRLRARDGRWAKAGEEGEVCVRHPSVMVGYFNRPQETAAAFTTGGWLRTGDWGVLRPDGNLRLVGRLAQMFKSGGYNIYPREIELVLETHPAVALAAVVARPDPDYQEVGVAFIQPKAGAEVTPDELDTWCRPRMANFKVPKQFRILEALPLLQIGKIDKPALVRLAVAEGGC